MGLGIPVLSLGGIALAVGLVGNVGSVNGLSGTWGSGEPWLPPLIVGGAAGVAAGATMIVLGKRKLVPVADAPTARLHVGPASFVVEGTF